MANGLKIGGSCACAVLALVLTACGKDPAPTVVEQSEPVKSAQTAEPVRRPAEVVLLAGYTPSFPHRVRSQRDDVAADGSVTHVVVMEYLSVPDSEISSLLRADLEKTRLRVRGPNDTEGGVRYVAQSSSIGVMRFNIHFDPDLSLGPEAEGTIVVSWSEAK